LSRLRVSIRWRSAISRSCFHFQQAIIRRLDTRIDTLEQARKVATSWSIVPKGHVVSIYECTLVETLNVHG
jgi:hypothetical protein